MRTTPTKNFLWLLVFFVAIYNCEAETNSSDGLSAIITYQKPDLHPVAGTTYYISKTYLYTGTEDPGPAFAKLNTAWRIANEFVFRTALQAEYYLPAGNSKLIEDENALISFTPKRGNTELTILVNWKNNTVEIIGHKQSQVKPNH